MILFDYGAWPRIRCYSERLLTRDCQRLGWQLIDSQDDKRIWRAHGIPVTVSIYGYAFTSADMITSRILDEITWLMRRHWRIPLSAASAYPVRLGVRDETMIDKVLADNAHRLMVTWLSLVPSSGLRRYSRQLVSRIRIIYVLHGLDDTNRLLTNMLMLVEMRQHGVWDSMWLVTLFTWLSGMLFPVATVFLVESDTRMMGALLTGVAVGLSAIIQWLRFDGE